MARWKYLPPSPLATTSFTEQIATMTNPLLAQIQDSFFPPCRVGINGFGRIGRAAFRASLERNDLIGT